MNAPRRPHDVIDPATRRVRVLARRCDTCIFWRDHRSPIGEARTDEVIRANVRAGALLTCHSTLPYGEHPGFGPAVCAGFWAEHRGVLAGRIAERLIGVDRVEPPARARRSGMVGRRYVDGGDRLSGRRDPPEVVTVLARWGPGGGPRNVLVQRQDGAREVIPFPRRLRRHDR